MKTKRLTFLAMATAAAMVLSYVESLIPPLMAVPGMKMGLPNIMIVFVLYSLNWRDALAVSLVRVVLASLLFGTVLSLAYSLAGAIISLAGMILLKRTEKFSPVAVSVTGGVLHNAAQIGVACLVMETNLIAYYLPFLVLSGTVAGILIGFAAAFMVGRVKFELR
ncbi:MAG: Gx transporter family protein [Oscillospiraceae bacterium]|nr:Gx transporter family protein [Oscillospiraceae bacterium]